MSILPSNANEILRNSGVNSLPDSPSAHGFNAKEIKAAIQRNSMILLSWLQMIDETIGLKNATVKVVSALPVSYTGYEANSVFIVVGEETLKFYVYDGEDADLIFDSSGVSARTSALEALFTDGKANKAIADGENNEIATTYVHKAGSETITGQKTHTEKIILNGQSGNGELALYYAYVSTNSKDYFVKAGSTSATASVYKLPYGADSTTYTIATTSQMETAKTEAVASAKSYADSTFLKPADIVDNLTTANEYKPLSAKQGKALKDALDTLSNYIYDGASNTSIDRLQEVFAFLTGHDDDETLDALLAQKASISALQIGDIIVGRTLCDKNNNDITTTYFSKEDGFAIGLVEVTDYDDSTGEITLSYNSDAISSITYDSSTGIVSFTY